MALLTTGWNKDIEMTDLETHVTLCAERRAQTSDRIGAIEEKMNLMETRSRATMSMLMGGLISLATGTVSAAITILFRHGIF